MIGPNQRPVVVVVDDEDIILISVSTLLRLHSDYEVVTFSAPEEALSHVRDHEVDLVISDYLMPDMDGITFLSKVRQLRPDVPRVILTGYADKENAIKGINQVGLFQYIEKPWDNDALLLVLRNAIERRQLVKDLHQKIIELDGAQGELQGIHKEILKTFV